MNDNEGVPISPLPGGSPGVPATQIVPDVWPIVPVTYLSFSEASIRLVLLKLYPENTHFFLFETFNR